MLFRVPEWPSRSCWVAKTACGRYDRSYDGSIFCFISSSKFLGFGSSFKCLVRVLGSSFCAVFFLLELSIVIKLCVA